MGWARGHEYEKGLSSLCTCVRACLHKEEHRVIRSTDIPGVSRYRANATHNFDERYSQGIFLLREYPGSLIARESSRPLRLSLATGFYFLFLFKNRKGALIQLPSILAHWISRNWVRFFFYESLSPSHSLPIKRARASFAISRARIATFEASLNLRDVFSRGLAPSFSINVLHRRILYAEQNRVFHVQSTKCVRNVDANRAFRTYTFRRFMWNFFRTI